jgi:hypothetical protein
MKRTITEIYHKAFKRKILHQYDIKKRIRVQYYDYAKIDLINFKKYYPYLFF